MIKSKVLQKINDKKTISNNIVLSILLVVVLAFISIGYAVYGQNLYFSGNISFGQQGKFAISSVNLIDSINVRYDSVPAFTDDSIDFNLVFEKDSDSSENGYKAVYRIILTNDTFYDYDFSFASFAPKITNSNGIEVDSSTLSYTVDGLVMGERIKAGESREVTLTILFTPTVDDTYMVDGNLNTVVIEKPHGSILASIVLGENGDLRTSLGNNIFPVTISIINSYQSDKEVMFTINNPKFVLCDSSGNSLDNVLINGLTTSDVVVYVKLADGALFGDDSVTTSISMKTSDDGIIDCGSINILVDVDESYTDFTPPIISNVVASIENATSSDVNNQNVGSIKLTWSVDDEDVDHYTILAYKGDNSLLGEFTTTQRSYVFNDLVDGDYYFKVYGMDNSKNKNTASSSDINNATTDAGFCSRTSVSNFKWHYTVTTNLTYVTESNTVKKVNRGYNYTTTVTKNNDTQNGCNTTSYKLPDKITVKMDNVNIGIGTSNGEYQYTGSSSVASGNITVYGVTGDLDITVTGTTA